MSITSPEVMTMAALMSKPMLSLGTWQQIVVLNFDTKARRRRVVVQIIWEQVFFQ
ncbi:hypothetical protein IPdc08_00609 [archaeon]|nr:hypothetical protein IPdc08_00609 [archaeon]